MKTVKDLDILFEDEFYWLSGLDEFNRVEDVINYLETNYNFDIHEFVEYNEEILSFKATTTIGDLVKYYENEYVDVMDYKEILDIILDEVVNIT